MQTIGRPWELDESDWRGLVQRVRAGRPLKPSKWAGGARFAVALSFDCDHETFELGAGRSSVGRLSWGEYGRRVGVPRILDVLARHEVPATFFIPAVCALLDPTEIPRIRHFGHEIGMHGWIHENNSKLDADTERRLMRQAHAVLTEQLGEAPVGFRSANWDLSPSTIDLVSELGLLYDSSLMADDSCYELMSDGKPTGIVEIPVEWLRDDAVYLLFNREPATRPWMSPDEVYSIFRRELYAAHAEGGLFQLVMHPFVIGYRSRIWILDQLIKDAQEIGAAWFATHEQIARYVLKYGGDVE